MKVLVTGGAGFIGSNLVDRLLERGAGVSVVDNLFTGFEENLNPKAKFYRVDVREKDKLREVFEAEKPDYVHHLAAQMDVRKSVEEPTFDAENNILGGLNVITSSLESGVKKIVYASTGGAVYGEPQYLPVNERHPINPICQYGISKHTFEHYLYLYRYLYGLNYTVLRYPNVYGPRQNPKGEAGVNAIFIGMMLKGETPTIFGDGRQLRDYVYVGDVIEANTLAMEKGDGEIYNIGSGVGISVNKIYSMLSELLSFNKPPIYAPPRPGEIEKVYLDSSKVQKELGWKPKVSFEDGLRKTISWFRNSGR